MIAIDLPGHGQSSRADDPATQYTGPCMLHNPSYDFNDDLIPLGATAWVRIAEAWLARPAPAGYTA